MVEFRTHLFFPEQVKRYVLFVAMLEQEQNFLSERNGVQPSFRGQNVIDREYRMRRTASTWWLHFWKFFHFTLSGTVTNDMNTWFIVNEAGYYCVTRQPRNAPWGENFEKWSQRFSPKRFLHGAPSLKRYFVDCPAIRCCSHWSAVGGTWTVHCIRKDWIVLVHAKMSQLCNRFSVRIKVKRARIPSPLKCLYYLLIMLMFP